MDDLTTGIIAFQQAALMSKVQYSVAKKVLQNQQFQGDAAVKLIEAAGKTASQGGDALVAAATGLGGQLDAYA
jgi:NAD(P)H-hydrate repair Nnr-like enzyme with NAD(P)H-hydrate epimerase domain